VSKTIKDCLRDATTIEMDKREMEKHCGNALAEIERLESILQVALSELISFRDNYTGEFASERLERLMNPPKEAGE
jgi:hypothetical protein